MIEIQTVYMRSDDFVKLSEGHRLLCRMRRREITNGSRLCIREMDKRGRPAERWMFGRIENEAQASQNDTGSPSMAVWVSMCPGGGYGP